MISLLAINQTMLSNLHRLKGQGEKVTFKLKKALNEIQLAQRQPFIEAEWAVFENLDQATKQKVGLQGGVSIKILKAGKWQHTGIKRTFGVLPLKI